MSEMDNLNLEDNKDVEKQELDILKKRADMLGVKYSPNIGIETLRERVKAAQEGKKEEEETDNKSTKEEDKKEKAKTLSEIRKEALKKVRVRITLMNQRKNNLPGEIFTVSNDVIGTVKRFIPFDPEAYENGYHVEQCILNQVKSKKYLHIKEERHRGVSNSTGSFVPEFAIEYLPPLTPKELQELRAQQAAKAGKL